jgi:hypothetical protein
MLIIYEENDLSTLSFINHCRKHNYSFIALNVEDLVKDDFSIIDFEDKCTFYVKGAAVYLHEIQGIYLRTTNLPYSILTDYKQGDIEYVRKEWWSYLVYLMSKFKNCMNPITLELISYSVFEAPFFFEAALDVGLKVPKYIFSNSRVELDDCFYNNEQKKYMAQSSLVPSTDFRPSKNLSNNTIGLIEYIKGNPIFVHIVDNNIFSCIYHKSERINIELDNLEKEKCLSLSKTLNLRAVQIIFIEQENTKDKFLINLSPTPNWNLNHPDNVDSIFYCLYEALTKS